MPSKRYWVSWVQEGNDGRPVKWPPPPEVLAFWETGFSEDDTTVVALVEADAEDPMTVIRAAWEPGVVEIRFCEERREDSPPGTRFPPPDWSVEMGRWPWPT